MRTYRLPLLSCLFLAAATADAATLVVTSAADTGGTTCGSVCTLRQAINVANATTAADTIHFAIAVPIRGEILITPATPLPTITQPLTINGYSQSGTRINDDPSFSNAVLRIRLSGQAQGASSSGLRVCAPDVTLQGLSITDFGVAVRIGNTGTGDCLATNTRVLGNFIGLTSSGVTVAGNDTGIFARTASIIGDASNGHRNVFAGGNSIILSGQITNGSSINGNLFGLTRGGADVTGGIVAIATGQSASNIVIGGLLPNTIRNYQRGFSVESTSRGIDLANNRISASSILGIDLGGDGFTPNDVDDIDSGANDRQNFPEITAANRVPGGLALSGLLDIGHPGGLVYTLTTYASPACHPGGHGDGARILGQTNRTVSSTAESFNYTQATTDPLPPGTVITMTATRAGVGTSEFSACFALDPPPLVVNAQDDVADGNCNAAHCSLRDAIIVANGAPAGSARSIHFAIPPLTGTSEIVIAPNAPLPMITRTVTIDGYTQPGTAVNTDPSASNAVLRIRLDGANLSGLATGLVACADSVVSGLSITRFRAAAIANEGCPFGSGATVAGNFIGLATDGVTAGANGLGVNISNGPMRVGGTTPADRNLIAASTFSGVFVFAPFGLANGTSVLGNLIGTDRTGLLDRGNADRGVSVENAREVLVGSLDAPNLLAYNQYGVRALGDAQSTLAANRFVGNDALAIELGELGVNPNDPGDGDTGPNGLQNHPVLTLAERTDSGIRVVGSLDSPVTGPTDAKTIAVYASASCHSSGHGPGEQLLGVFPIVAPEFDQNLLTDVDLDQYAQITATATGAEGTSEMSACRLATDPAPGIAVDSAQDGAPNGGCDITGDGNPCTLREAILHANAASGSDVIRFAIAGDGPHVITLGSVLPTITGSLRIDGYTQLGAVRNADPVASDAVIRIDVRAPGLPNALRVCTTGTLNVEGLAISGGTSATIDTRANEAGDCGEDASFLLAGSWVGFTASGVSVGGSVGIRATNTRLTLGGITLADRNVIAGHSDAAVIISGAHAGGGIAFVINSLFGISPGLGNGTSGNVGIRLATSGAVVGANRFFGGTAAIVVTGATSDFNNLYANDFAGSTSGTAIDLVPGSTPDGITPNDVNDVDSGANDGQNTPVLTDASATPGSFVVNGVLDVPAGITTPVNYRIALYRSTFCSDQGGVFGGRNGNVYLGVFDVPLASSAENFSVTVDLPSEPGFITATATAPDGSTSEMSNCLAAPRPVLVFADGFE